MRWEGTAVDPAVRIPFSFEGAAMEGIAGDTIASALAANGVHLVGPRSGRQQRDRLTDMGAADGDDVTVGEGTEAVAHVRAEEVDLVAGMAVCRQGARTLLGHAASVASGFLRAVLPTRSPGAAEPGAAEQLEVDVAVVGGGIAGLAAAVMAAEAGAHVLLVEATPRLGGWLLSAPGTHVDGAPAEAFIIDANIALARSGATVLTRTSAVRSGTGGGLILRQRTGALREQRWQVRAREVVLATGPAERMIPFRGNDRPGVMLASTAVTLARRYGAAPGRRAVVLMADDTGSAAAAILADAGIEIAATLDMRLGDGIARTEGRGALSAVHVRRRGGRPERIPCDLIVVAGGLEAASFRFARSSRRVPGNAPPAGSQVRAAGGAAGHFGIDEALADGVHAGAEAVRALGLAPNAGTPSDDPAAGTSALFAALRRTRTRASGDCDATSGRTTSIHDWHNANGAVLERAGGWLRPIAYPRDGETIGAAVVREAAALRHSAGVVDASPLGKVEIRGPCARAFLDWVADAATAELTPGRSRAVVLAGDDGAVVDAGVLTCLSADHFHLATTDGDDVILDHLARRLRAGVPQSVFLTSVTEASGVARLCGPGAGAVLSHLVGTVPDVPFPGFAAARVDGVPVRLFRQLGPGAAGADGWEVNIPAPFALSVWERIVAAGAVPCGAAAVQRLRARQRFIVNAEGVDASDAERAVPSTGDGEPPATRRPPMLRRMPAADLVHDGDGVRMWPVDLAPIALRVEPRESQAVEQAIGVPLPDPHRSVVGEPRHGPARGSEVTLLGRGSDDWLILAAPDRATAIVADLEAALAATHRQVVDLSGGLVVLALAGEVDPLLASASAPPLAAPPLAPGSVMDTTIADAPALLHRRSAERVALIVRASSARHVAARLGGGVGAG